MLRLKLVASVIPLIVVGVFARDRLLHDARPCIALGDTSVQLAAGPWQGPLRVSFTDNRIMANVRVQLVDSAEMADFAVVDDVETPNADSCQVNASTRFVAIDESETAKALRIHFSTEPGGDYRVYVDSRRFTAWEAAALIVAARNIGGQQHLAAAF